MTYQEALEYIASLEKRGWRLGLDRMQEFVDRAGLTDSIGGESGPQFIQVAGTNGKGSVTAYLQSMLVETGYHTGAFFSPYVFNPRERVQYGRRLIPEGIFAKLTQLLQPIGESLSETEFGGVTEFEFKTAMGFMFWKELECEWVALEVGLGGRLDATNVVHPKASVIVSIGLDHTQILGDTLEKIAYEKAGVVKPHVPVIVGDVPEEALKVIEAQAAEMEAPVWVLGREIHLSSDIVNGTWTVETPLGKHAGLVPGIPGAMQEQNMALAVAAMNASGATRTLRGLVDGAKNAQIPGRFQQVRYKDRTVILDGAHNADAGRVLRLSLEAFLREPGREDTKVILVASMVAGHEPRTFFETITPMVSEAHLVPIDFPRAQPTTILKEEMRGLLESVTAYASVEAGLEAALGAARPQDVVLVTGSFYLVGEAGRLMGLGSSD